MDMPFISFDRMKPEPISDEAVTAALDRTAAQVRRNLPEFTYACQNHSSIGNVYPACENNQWTCGFWPGEIWLAYEHTGDPAFREAGLIQVESFYNRIKNKIAVDHHDMGFLYSPSCVSAWMLTGSEKAKEAAVLAADQLITRFQTVGGFLQAWGAMGAAENYRYIIDCLMNLPLLYWATEMTGDKTYREIALRHTDTCLRYSFRSDGSTYHTYYLDPDTGSGVRGVTCQGYRDDSAWARGQAWAIYGAALSYRYTKDPRCMDHFHKALGYYLTRLPEDGIPYWDLILSDGSGEPRDSSSAAIAACGLLEMEPFLGEKDAEKCRELARRMVGSLAENYSVGCDSGSNGQLLHGTYSKKSPYNTCTPEGVDECVSWGDYFYMEALTRLNKAWKSYW